ncbi:Gfo/Idh/MocA family oxidoreductase [Metabacillus sp. GX 13764]|uniref:Gfo/Idh/MocA family protein n=1 Tax=Metabacillus kandeliae TaxID=2900151 RepID=UPI001E3AEC92|nr:Gfo/Idh/MocA family oxidoreductase [Metabacillus kandeliae]MCD7035450.1 Gfo/Idh/MocA family oxidoreductase [Metabacillus kandeliae]
MKKTRFAIIGCGVISRIHQQQIQKIPGAIITAAADESLEKAKSFAALCDAEWYTDYKKLLARTDIDIVSILTPSGTHSAIAVEAARAGKHVICEKPMDVTGAKALTMIEECRKAGVKLSVISQHRFDASTVKAKMEIEKGTLGRMMMGHAAIPWYRTQQYYDSGKWRGTWELDGGGVLMNQGIHTIDLLQHLMGPADSVFAYTDVLAHERIEVEDAAAAVIRFKSGAIGTITGTTGAYPGFPARLELFGSKGSAVISDDALTHFFTRDGTEEKNSCLVQDTRTGAAGPEDISGEAHRLQLLDMIQAIDENREPLVNGEEGLKPLEIILAIYESAKTGKPAAVRSFLEEQSRQNPA